MYLWAIDENIGTNLQAFYKHFYIGCLKTQNQQLHFVKIKNNIFFLNSGKARVNWAGRSTLRNRPNWNVRILARDLFPRAAEKHSSLRSPVTVHSHVEWSVVAQRESALGRVELHRGRAEVKDHRVDLTVRDAVLRQQRVDFAESPQQWRHLGAVAQNNRCLKKYYVFCEKCSIGVLVPKNVKS